MDFPHTKIAEVEYGGTIFTLSYQEADRSEGMTGWFLNLWRRSASQVSVEGTFGSQVAYKNVILESNWGKTPQQVVKSAMAVINNWFLATTPILEAGKVPTTPEEKQAWKNEVKVLLEKLTFAIVDGIPQVQ